jgi:hypothetical protein
MARRGGYTRNVEGIEWAKLSEQMDARGKLSAARMGQSYYTWLNDAVAHHDYRCEVLEMQERYQQAQTEATANNMPTVDQRDYRVTRPVPTITREQPGVSTGSRGPRARP